MQGVTKEQIDRAKQIDLLTYFRAWNPQELVRLGAHDYTTKTHDSLKISDNGLWHWYSRNKGGRTALEYLLTDGQMDFIQAVRYLCEEEAYAPVFFQPVNTVSTPAKVEVGIEYRPPSKDLDATKACAYLEKRCIRAEVMTYCMEAGTFYQNTHGKFTNCVFVGKDAAGVPRAASMRGCGGHFRGDAAGRQKQYGFCIPALNKGAKVVEVFEAPIDAMSGASLRILRGDPNWRKVHYLALSGLNRQALECFLHMHPEVTRIRLCLDADKPGRTFAQKLKQWALESGYAVVDSVPAYGKDYNDTLQQECRIRAQRVYQASELETKKRNEYER